MSALDDLPSRQNGRLTELQCPVCATWRAAFLLTPTPPERVAEVGEAEWVCDVERSRWTRQAVAAAELAAAEALPAVKAAQRALINAARDAARDGGALTSFGVFDSNHESRTLIAGAVAVARELLDADLPFTEDWTLADNSVVTLSGEQMRQAGVEVGLHVSAIFARARVLQQRIEAAETVEAVRAVVWSLEDGA